MIWSRGEPYVKEKAIVAFVDGNETPFSIMLSNSRISFTQDGKKTVPEGIFICRIGSEFHCLPRTNTTGAFSTTTSTGSISLPRLFVSGDILTVIEGHQICTFSGSWTASSTIEITLPTGAIKTLTLGAGSGAVSLPTVALTVASYINNDPVVSGFMSAKTMGASVFIYNKQELSPPTIAIQTSGSGVASVDVKGSFTVIGTILKVEPTTGAVILTAPSQVNVPIGAHIGVIVDEVFGVYPHAMDLTDKPRYAIAPIAGSHGVYENALPYIDSDLKRKCHQIRFAAKF